MINHDTVCVVSKDKSSFKLYFAQMIAEVLLLLAASSTGWYYKFMTHKANRIMFSGTRTCIESRIKLECEKEQQEQLLLSVIPAYIAAEVSSMTVITMFKFVFWIMWKEFVSRKKFVYTWNEMTQQLKRPHKIYGNGRINSIIVEITRSE